MGKIAYVEAFRAATHQLNERKTGLRWVEAGVSLEDAIAWADLGYLPEEAAPLIAAGQNPADIAAINSAMSTGDRIEDAVAQIMLLTGGTADEDEIRKALADRAAVIRPASTFNTPPDIPAAELIAIPAERLPEIIAALNSGDENEPDEVVWMGVHGDQIMARLADGTDLIRTQGIGWH